jgi:uncharacterized protein (TIGR02996 family)
MMLRDTLLQAVLDHPDDDPPRLEYASWLEANGDERERARGAFICADVGLARMAEEDPARPALEARRAELLRRRGKPWLLGLGEWANDERWLPLFSDQFGAIVRRGFVEEVVTNVEDFLRDAAVLAREPLTRFLGKRARRRP